MEHEAAVGVKKTLNCIIRPFVFFRGLLSDRTHIELLSMTQDSTGATLILNVLSE